MNYIYQLFFKSVKDGKIEIVNMFIINGVNVNSRDKYKDTALHHASAAGHKDIVKFLLECGALVDSNDSDNPPLQLAVLYNHNEIVKLLLSYNADPNAFDYSGLTALHLSAEKGNIETLELLLEKNGKVDILNNKTGNSLIHSAAIGITCGNNNCWDLIQYLLKNYREQLDPFCVNNAGKQPGDILDNYDWSFAEKYEDLLENLGYFND